ncbi:MAG: glutamate--tRNA ligase, partial [Terriglobales bacterium]
PTGGTRETFTPEELVKEFSLERVTPSPAVFDMQKLYWLNRHYIAHSQPERIHALALPFFTKAGFLPDSLDAATSAWFATVIALVAPSVDKLEELPARAAMFFQFDPQAAIAAPDNAEVMAWEKTAAVIAAFAQCVAAERAGEGAALTAERFKAIVNEVKAETGAKGKELFHPIRIAITGSHSGPEFDKLIPMIEAGSRLQLPTHVLSVRERVERFAAALAK